MLSSIDNFNDSENKLKNNQDLTDDETSNMFFKLQIDDFLHSQDKIQFSKIEIMKMVRNHEIFKFIENQVQPETEPDFKITDKDLLDEQDFADVDALIDEL